MKYKTNFKQTPDGNGIQTGTVLTVKIEGARIVSGWIAKKTFYGRKMLQVAQDKHTLKFKLKKYKHKRLVGYDTGKYILKVSAFDSQNKNQQWSDEFEVV
tara:strand:- start:374 stop:673 length:300 start_codon:yes stop_codon:yes gene_type:complete